MVAVAMIPARYDSTRFPGKLMQRLGDKSVIATTYLATLNTGLFSDVIVVTDSNVIREEIEKYGGKVVMSQKEHESGTDRIAEVAATMDVEVILNVQGDSPFIKTDPLRRLLGLFEEEVVQVASLMRVLYDEQFISNPNNVKVCVDKNGNALFFSRSVIPYPRNKNIQVTHYEHIGVYAFRKQALINFTTWPVSPLEDAEKIECLRFLENGVSLRMVVTEHKGVEIDTPEDLERAVALL